MVSVVIFYTLVILYYVRYFQVIKHCIGSKVRIHNDWCNNSQSSIDDNSCNNKSSLNVIQFDPPKIFKAIAGEKNNFETGQSNYSLLGLTDEMNVILVNFFNSCIIITNWQPFSMRQDMLMLQNSFCSKT